MSDTLIIGTGKEIEIFEDSSIVKKLEQNFIIYCINSSYYYFNKIDSLFLNCEFKNFSDKDLLPRQIKKIYCQCFMKNITEIPVKKYNIEPATYFKLNNNISVNIDDNLPHGPTTLLDIVFPVCGYLGHKNIYLFGLNYPKREENYIRFNKDSDIIKRNATTQNELNLAHKKIKLWHKYFKKNNVNCFDLSKKSETPFIKKDFLEVL